MRKKTYLKGGKGLALHEVKVLASKDDIIKNGLFQIIVNDHMNKSQEMEHVTLDDYLQRDLQHNPAHAMHKEEKRANTY